MTTIDPRQTANDLRVAAHAIETAGHGVADEISYTTGHLCLLGGIGVATGIYGIETLPIGDRRRANRFTTKPFVFEPTTPADEEPCPLTLTASYPITPPRAQAAIDAVARVLPDTAVYFDKAGVQGTFDKSKHKDPSFSVYHYNDFVCRGGEDACALLIEAAEKIEADLP